MLLQEYRPTVRDLVEIDDLPDNLGFLADSLGTILDQIYYQNLIVNQTVSGDQSYYNLDLVVKRELRLLTVPGTDISLILNPPDEQGDQTGSVFNLSFEYQWEILKYVRDAKLSTFAFDVRGFIDLLSGIFGITEADLTAEAVNVFVGDLDNPPTGQDPLQDFVDLFNSLYTPPLTYTPSGDPGQDVLDIVDQIQAGGNDVIQVIVDNYLEGAFERLKLLIARWVGPLDQDRLLRLVIPRMAASLNGISFGLALPRSVFIPLDDDDEPTPEPAQSMIRVSAGSIFYDTERGLTFEEELHFTFTRSAILSTGFTIEISGIKIDLSETTNIPEATAEGRPPDFQGVYIQEAEIGFPAFWNHDAGASTGKLTGQGLIAGTGGLSGLITLAAIDGSDPAPLIKACFGNGFQVSLDAFSLEFQQNAIIGSNIGGTMVIPGFKDAGGVDDALINILVHIGQEGDFAVTASEADGIKIGVPNIFDFYLTTAEIGREDDRFYLAVAGAIEFLDQGGAIGQLLPDKIDIQKLIIWDDGDIELEGGKITLPKAVSLKIGPAELSVSAIGLGAHEQEYGGHLRQYKYFVFDGSIGVDPGGVEASGNGVSFYYTVDNDDFGGDGHVFVRIQSIAIDLVIPGDATEETAALLLKGFLSMKSPEEGGDGTEYAGGVEFTLPSLKMGGSAAMRLNPKVPAFLIDVGLEIATPILLGATGLGIYGFRGLVGQQYVATKSAAGLSEDALWWQYYKAKIADTYEEGITVDKFEQTNGFSLGAGVSLATVADAGRTFSSKIFFLLSLPEVFLLQGQGQILKERIGLDTSEDPPFYALIAITSTSVEAAFGVDYLVPDDGPQPGAIATVNGLIEMGFFFGDAAAWYVNLGKDQPEDRRIQVRLLTLFNAYFYMMLSSSGIRAGAGASYDLTKKFGPLRAELYAYLDTAGKLSFKPKQIGASIHLGGGVGLYIFKFGFSLNANATLAAEAPKPFMVTGSFEACVRVLRKDRCAKFDFTWIFDNNLDTSEIKLLKDNPGDSAKAVNIQTQDSFALYAATSQPSTSQVDDYIIPADCFIDVEFVKGVLPAADVLDKFGGNTQGSLHIDYVAPQRGKSDRVRHEYTLDRVSIKYHDGSNWVDYDVYEAATPLQLAPFVTTDLATLPFGYWQYQTPDLHNKLRILGQSPIEYVSQGAGGLIPEQLHITDESIFCAPASIEKHCIRFDGLDPGFGLFYYQPLLPEGELFFHLRALFRIGGSDGVVADRPWNGFEKAVRFGGSSELQIDLIEPAVTVTLRVLPRCNISRVTFYEQVLQAETGAGGQPLYAYIEVESDILPADLPGTAVYQDLNRPVHRVVISSGSCRGEAPGEAQLVCEEKITETAEQLLEYLQLLAERGDLIRDRFDYNRDGKPRAYRGVLLGTVLMDVPITKDTYIWHARTRITENTLCWAIKIVEETHCDLCLSLLEDIKDFSWKMVIGFENLRPDPKHLSPGENYDFLVDAVLEDGRRVTLRGESCYNIINCRRQQPDECGLDCLILPEAAALENFLNTFCRNHPTTIKEVNIWPQHRSIYDGVFFHSVLYGDVRRRNPIDYELDYQEVDTWVFYVRNELGFECKFFIQVIDDTFNGDWDAVVGFTGLSPDPEYRGEGENLHFTGRLVLEDGRQVAVKGNSCYPVGFCQSACATYLYELCTETYEAAVYNENLPDQSEVDEEIDTLIAGLSGSIRPIWRFDTRFLIEIETTDTLYRDSGSDVLATYSNTYYYGFRTAGPIGHFHRYQDEADVTQIRDDYAALLAADREDEYKFARLLHYIDFARSYPNADGQLINAKPLFYKTPKLLLFYLQSYVYEFYREWDDYNGSLTALQSELQLVIKDPAPPPDQPAPPPTGSQWNLSTHSLMSADVQILNNMMANAAPEDCPPGEEINPPAVYSSFSPEDLKPGKLYTAIFNALLKRDTDSNFIVREVHRYGFQTSRYSDFREQVQSYLLSESEEADAATRPAVFVLEKAFDATAHLAVAQQILDPADALPPGHPLRQTFAHAFNRLIDGALQLPALHPPVSTEFNLIVDTLAGKLIGILVKNPEPFNDPKLPETEAADTLRLSVNGGNTGEYITVFSRDLSQAFITNADLSMDIPANASLEFTFEYRLWDGVQYATEATESVSLDLGTYL